MTTIDEIIVTGSRLRRDTFDAPIPIVSVDTETIELSGATSIGELVSELPVLGTGPSRVSNLGVGAPEAIGTNLLDLRNLGENRTLVVVDGRRHIGSVRGTTAVDVDSIPVALIERVDIATGGATVAYGADAVSGVVNIVLKKDFEGVETDMRGGASGEGDADDYYVSLTAGGNFNEERGNATLNLTFNRVYEVDGRDRDWLARQRVFIPNPANTGPNDGIPAQIMADNGRVALLPFQGIVAGLLTGLPNQ
ncbi:MAG: TonB-dependent receptor plug domain-containing protein, partial [Steroidobacteraceae bacterium]